MFDRWDVARSLSLRILTSSCPRRASFSVCELLTCQILLRSLQLVINNNEGGFGQAASTLEGARPLNCWLGDSETKTQIQAVKDWATVTGHAPFCFRAGLAEGNWAVGPSSAWNSVLTHSHWHWRFKQDAISFNSWVASFDPSVQFDVTFKFLVAWFDFSDFHPVLFQPVCSWAPSSV